MPTTNECKRILSRLGFKLGVSPKLIAERLLSKEDKQDMLNGLVSVEMLEAAVKAWQEAGLPDYANGSVEPMKRM